MGSVRWPQCQSARERFRVSHLSLPHAQLQFTGAGGRRDGAGPGRVEQGFDLAVGQVALLEHMALITRNEQEVAALQGLHFPGASSEGLLLPVMG